MRTRTRSVVASVAAAALKTARCWRLSGSDTSSKPRASARCARARASPGSGPSFESERPRPTNPASTSAAPLRPAQDLGTRHDVLVALLDVVHREHEEVEADASEAIVAAHDFGSPAIAYSSTSASGGRSPPHSSTTSEHLGANGRDPAFVQAGPLPDVRWRVERHVREVTEHSAALLGRVGEVGGPRDLCAGSAQHVRPRLGSDAGGSADKITQSASAAASACTRGPRPATAIGTSCFAHARRAPPTSPPLKQCAIDLERLPQRGEWPLGAQPERHEHAAAADAEPVPHPSGCELRECRDRGRPSRPDDVRTGS